MGRVTGMPHAAHTALELGAQTVREASSFTPRSDRNASATDSNRPASAVENVSTCFALPMCTSRTRAESVEKGRRVGAAAAASAAAAHATATMSPLRTMATLAVLTLLALCHASAAAPAHGTLIVVGDVTHDSARVLLELLPHAPAHPLANLAGRQFAPHDACAPALLTLTTLASLDPLATARLDLTTAVQVCCASPCTPVLLPTPLALPQVLVVEGLQPNTNYMLHVTGDAGGGSACGWSLPPGDDGCTWLTMPLRGQPPPTPLNLAVMSCDRYVDDSDDGFLAALQPVAATAHIGDQVYTDSLAAAIARAPPDLTFLVRARTHQRSACV